jgi:hypothetical protein
MKPKVPNFAQIAFTAVLVLFFLLPTTTFSQEKAYWQGLAVKNPAIIGTNSDWAYLDYSFLSNDNNDFSAIAFGVDVSKPSNRNTIGVNFYQMKLGMDKIVLFELNYAYSLPISDFGTLNFGITSGFKKYIVDLHRYNTLAVGGLDNEYATYLKAVGGLFFNSANLDVGVSYTYFSELNHQFNNKESWYHPVLFHNTFNILGAYRFNVEDIFVIEPNVMFEFSDYSNSKFLGVFFEYNKIFWAGYTNINFNKMHSISLGVDIYKFRIGYSNSFKKPFNKDYSNLHEIMVAFRMY